MTIYAPRGSGYTMPSNNRRPTVAAGGPQVAANTQRTTTQPTAPGIGAPQIAPRPQQPSGMTPGQLLGWQRQQQLQGTPSGPTPGQLLGQQRQQQLQGTPSGPTPGQLAAQQRQQGILSAEQGIGQPIMGQSGQPSQPSQYGQSTGIGGGFNFQPQSRNDYNMQQRESSGGLPQGYDAYLSRVQRMNANPTTVGGVGITSSPMSYEDWQKASSDTSTRGGQQGGGQQSPGFEGNWMFGGSNMGGGQQGGGMWGMGGHLGMNGQSMGQRINQGPVDQYGGAWTSDPEQRWAQQPGALPYGPQMTGNENKFNYVNMITQQGPSVGSYANQMPNPANMYGNLGNQAQNFLGGLPGSMGQNPFMGQGQNLLNYGMGQLGGGGGPQAPNIQGAPTNYNYQNQQAPGFRPPQFDQMNVGQFDPNSIQGPNVPQQQMFDPNSVQGPNMPQIRQPNAQFGGPQLNAPTQGPSPNVPGFRDILSLSNTMTGNAGNVPREQLGGSGFEQNQNFNQFNSLAGQGLQSGLGAAQSLAQGGGFGIDAAALDKAAQRQYELAAQAGANKAIGRGFSPSGGSIGGREIGQAVADEAGRQAIQRQQLIMQAEANRQQGRIAGANALQGIGGTAGGLAGDQAGRLMNESQFLGQGGLTQRGQDIGQNQFNAGQGTNNLQALTGLAGTLGGLDINSFEAGTGRAGTLGNLGLGAFNAGTNRGTATGDMDLRTQQLMQQGALGGYDSQTGRMTGLGGLYNQGMNMQNQSAIDAYNAGTNRIGTQGNIFNQGQGNMIDAYGAATQRGQVGANAQNDYNNLGFNYANMNTNAGIDYANLGANNQNQYNQQLIDLYGQQGNQFNQGQQNQNDLLRTLLGGASDFSGQYQGGQMDMANLYANLLGQQGQFQQGYNGQWLGANAQDVGNFWDQYMNSANQGQAAQINRENNRFNFGRDALGGLVGGAAQIGAAYLGGGVGAAAGTTGGGYQGMPRQQLQYGGW